MLPIFFSFGTVKFYTFGFLFGIGFFWAAFIVWRRLIQLGYKEEKIIDLILNLSFWGLVSARLFYIGMNFPQFGFFLDRWFFWNRYPGFSFWGGMMGIILGLFWFSKRQKWDFWRIADELIFGLLPLLFLIQMGMFFDGTVIGKPTTMPWGIFFPGSLVRQQPVSLFWVFLLLLIWIFLKRIERQWRMWKWYKSKAVGLLSLCFFALISLGNFLLAFLKETQVYFFYLEIVLSFLAVIASLILIYWRSGRKLKND